MRRTLVKARGPVTPVEERLQQFKQVQRPNIFKQQESSEPLVTDAAVKNSRMYRMLEEQMTALVERHNE